MDLTLPVIHVEADNIAEGWEEAVLRTWKDGARIKTQYDPDEDTPLSRDAALCLTVRDPFAEPRLHRAFPGGITELETYRQEVVDGLHDHWIDENGWSYTYHELLTAMRVPGIDEPIDQIEGMVQALVEAPHTRRAQVTTWRPWNDPGITDPPCLQRIWCRIYGDELVMHINIRSNDAFKAAYMNMYAFTDLQRDIAERVSKGLGREIRPGQYTHVADSFHIYGQDFEEFKGFLKSVDARTWEQRTWTTEAVQPMIDEAREIIVRMNKYEIETGGRVKLVDPGPDYKFAVA